MPNLHNTLYVTSEGAYVSKSGESAVVKVDGSVRMQVPLHHLASIVCFGWAGVSPELMGACTEAGISVAFLAAPDVFSRVSRVRSAATFCYGAPSTAQPMIRPQPPH